MDECGYYDEQHIAQEIKISSFCGAAENCAVYNLQVELLYVLQFCLRNSEITMENITIPKKKKFSRKAKSNLFVLSFLIVPIVLFLIFYVAINLNSILLAFSNVALDGTRTFAGFSNFASFLKGIFSDGALLSISIVNSLKMYFISLVVCMPLYIIFSYLVYKKCFMHGAIRAISMLPQIISGFVVGLLFLNFVAGDSAPILKVFESMHIFVDENGKGIDLLHSSQYAFGTTIFFSIWISFGTNLIVYPNAMKEISNEVIESSRLDGVSTMFQDLRYIVLPLIFPTISTFLITGLAGIFSNGGSILTFYNVSAPEYVYNMGYYYTKSVLSAGSETAYPELAAGGLILTAIVAPLTLLLRHLLEKYGPTTEA